MLLLPVYYSAVVLSFETVLHKLIFLCFRCLTPDWVLCQLKYRYDREIDNSDR